MDRARAPAQPPRFRSGPARPPEGLPSRAAGPAGGLGARPWRSLIRGSLTARLIASLVALVIVTCAVVGAATYTVLRNSLMSSFSQSLQAATQRQVSSVPGRRRRLELSAAGPHLGVHRPRPRHVPG